MLAGRQNFEERLNLEFYLILNDELGWLLRTAVATRTSGDGFRGAKCRRPRVVSDGKSLL